MRRLWRADNNGLDRRRDGRFHSLGWGIEVRFDAAKGAAALWIGAQAFPADGEEGLGDGGRYLRVTASRSVPGGWLLSQSFDEQDTERPDIGRGGYIDGADFRRIVDAARTGAPAEVWRELHTVIDDHDVGWTEMTVRKTAVVKIGERTQHGAEHFPRFPGRERTIGKDLGEGFIGILGYDIEQILTLDYTASGMKKRHQVRMGEGPGYIPSSDGGAFIYCFEGEDLNGGFLRAAIVKLGQIGRAPLRLSQLLEERESSVDNALDRNSVEVSRTHGGPILTASEACAAMQN